MTMPMIGIIWGALLFCNAALIAIVGKHPVGKDGYTEGTMTIIFATLETILIVFIFWCFNHIRIV